MNKTLYSTCLFLFTLTLVGCAEGGTPDMPSTKTSTSTPVIPTPPPASGPTNFNLFHPVMTDIVTGNSQSECSQAASAQVGYAVSCSQGGGCLGGSAWGYCGLTPLPIAQRTNNADVSAHYLYADSSFPKVFPAARLLQHLYQKVYLREPDVEGFYYWMNDYFNNKGQGTTTRHITYLADAMIRHPDCALFQAAATQPTPFMQMLYLALFNQAADTPGLNYWVSQLSSGTNTRDQVVLHFYTEQKFADLLFSFGIN